MKSCLMPIFLFYVLQSGIHGQDCTFENNLCGWTNANNDDIDWIRQKSNTGTKHTGPNGDHTIGVNGHFVYIENTFVGDLGDKARLISPGISFTDDNRQCLTFWYHMYGAHIQTLNVYLADREGLGAAIWRRRGLQGNDWNKAQITLGASGIGAKNVVFEAVHGIIQGDISLDDITLVDGDCIPDYCDFEDGTALCGGIQDRTDTFDFLLSTGTLGSASDHTLGTSFGHLLMISTATDNRYGTARFITSTFFANSTKCLQFYHTKSGDQNIGALRVYAQIGSNRGPVLWSKSVSFEYGWYEERVTIETVEDFQIVFEVARNNGNSGYLGIDDVFVFDGVCSSVGDLPGSCDFEKGLCSWKNTFGDSMDWVENKGRTGTGGTGPSTDHTLGTEYGTYLYFEASNIVTGTTGAVYSEPYEANVGESRCMTFWYHMYGKSVGKLTIQQLLANGDVIDLWTMSGNQGTLWIPARVGYSQTQDYMLSFNATRGDGGPSGDICIDDIAITTGYCSSSYSIFDCDFEGDFCGWNQTTDDELEWIRNQGDTGSPHTGPYEDHTKGAYGWYLYIDNIAQQTFGDAARLRSPSVTFEENQPKCLTFWYHVYGAHVGSLSVYLEATQGLNPIWTRRTTLGDRWNQAKVNLLLTSDDTRSVVLEATQGYRIHGDIAIDDISLESGFCKRDYFGCDFEDNTLCGGSFESTGKFNWTLTAADDTTGPSYDYTYMTMSGHYLLLKTSLANQGQLAIYYTATTSTTSNRCLQFYYAGSNDDSALLSVLTKVNGHTSHPIWTRYLQIGDGWQTGQVSIKQQRNFKIIFIVHMLGNAASDAYVALDDIQLLDTDCPSPANCIFEFGKCTWRNSIVGDQLDWTLHKGGTGTGGTGPQNDHTVGTGEGTYLYLEGSNTNEGTYGAFYSEPLPGASNYRCFEFWYHMTGKHIGTFQVAILSKGDLSPSTIWTLSGDQGDSWLYGRIPFKQLDESQLVLIGIRGTGSNSDTAVDDLVISDGLCTGLPPEAAVNPPTSAPTPPTSNPCGSGRINCTDGTCIDITQYCDFTPQCPDSSDEELCPKSCNFEADECGWYEGTPKDNFNWHRARAYDTRHTPDLAPQYDHTNNGAHGYFTYIAPVGTNSYDTAEYMSPQFASAAPGCTLDFWLYMNDLVCDLVDNCDDNSDEMNCDDYIQCDFENDLCAWTQASITDNMNWLRISGPTPYNYYSGPPYDHTYSNTTGYFLYVDSSDKVEGSAARIATPFFPASKDVCTIRFWFHMYTDVPNTMGHLRVYTESNLTNDQVLLMWENWQNMGKHWNYAKVVLGNPHSFRVVFEAITGGKGLSDIAIDDITFTQLCRTPGDSSVPAGLCTRKQIFCPGDKICIDETWLNDGNIDCPTDCYDEEQFRFNCEAAVPLPTPEENKSNAGAIAGGVVGAVVCAVFVIVLIIVGITCYRKKGSFRLNINFRQSSANTPKVRMSDIDNIYNESPISGGKEFSLDNPGYEDSLYTSDPTCVHRTSSSIA
ncbi:MAM and LDL-receptor class A domain-containing protein 2-like [Saccoglossus kowalevskii]|uniref:MAM and LDL-receptor class A domain-containing protein C10orf112-like n=1 Tax=Saccoglossus kowalevskii TaxID=10224 RepID=A0ABM0MM41_SACKO|nr:PREDICTED: MAM and LDL-receptor class A domain-containing protein C10orf112-like [Saccoglossus kowalevskii]